jgi:hypothetical protein
MARSNARFEMLIAPRQDKEFGSHKSRSLTLAFDINNRMISPPSMLEIELATIHRPVLVAYAAPENRITGIVRMNSR